MAELRNFRAVTETAQHTQRLAAPPDWTAQGLCVGDWRPWDTDQMSDKAAAALCAGCPVIEACLTAAMEAEGDLVARNRYGIRGGLTPKARALLVVQEKTCPSGHVGRFDAHGDCLECRMERHRAKIANDPTYMEERARKLRESRAAQMVSCLTCKNEVRARSWESHLAQHTRGADNADAVMCHLCLMPKTNIRRHLRRVHKMDGAPPQGLMRAGRVA